MPLVVLRFSCLSTAFFLLILSGGFQAHGQSQFEFAYPPLNPAEHPHYQHPKNAHRLYDFYAKEADHYQQAARLPQVLPSFPGMEGAQFGHWGVTTESDWRDGRWNDTDTGSLVCGVLRLPGEAIAKAMCVRLGEDQQFAVCFDAFDGSIKACWRGAFLEFPETRFGYIGGMLPKGELTFRGHWRIRGSENQPYQFQGLYRHGNRVVFSYRIGDCHVLDSLSTDDDGIIRDLSFSPRFSGTLIVDQRRLPLKDAEGIRTRLNAASIENVEAVLEDRYCQGGPAQWPETIETQGIRARDDSAYVVDTLTMPYDNPWKALMSAAGHDFLPDGSAAVCTIHGDVWIVTGIDDTLDRLTWRRFAAGLHQPLGLVVVDGKIHVLGRDQITILHDVNADGEADHYECFTNAYVSSPGGHDYITGLERDEAGNFYFASANQGIVRVSEDGSEISSLSTGLRNPNGLGVSQGGTIHVSPQEGEWVPTSMICEAKPGRHFGFGGPRPKDGRLDPPLCYVPRGVDNASGGHVFVEERSRWGPLHGQSVMFSWGSAQALLVLREVVRGQEQGGVVAMPGGFLSGAHRGRFNPHDGQLYVTGAMGWVTYGPLDGCFQRVRYTGKPVHLPIALHVHRNGIRLGFAVDLDAQAATSLASYFCQQWNYRYGKAYGSDEYSARFPDRAGHDFLRIRSAHLLSDTRTVFLEIPEIQPVDQLHLRMKLKSTDGETFARDVFLTVHQLGEPYTEIPNYTPVHKTPLPDRRKNPIEDTEIVLTKHPTTPPSQQKANRVTIRCVAPLRFDRTQFSARPGELVGLTLVNDDVIPHNLVMVKPGKRKKVGDLASKMLSDPQALAKQYVPDVDDVLVHTLVIDPKASDTIYFPAPLEPGDYPYLCTFPGHWAVMQGVMRVEK